MDKEYLMEVINTTKNQLLGTTPINVLLSWGVTGFIATSYKEMPTLMFEVKGRLFTGFVMIALNEGADYYEIYLMNKNGAYCLAQDVAFDEMGMLIDRAIEKGENPDEYNNFCQQQWSKLIACN